MRLLALAVLASTLAASRGRAPAKAPPPAPVRPAVPTENAIRSPCPLQLLPDATVAWTDQGWLWLLEGPEVLASLSVGWPTPIDATRITCSGSEIQVDVVHGGTSLGVDRTKLDVGSIARAVYDQYSPETRAKTAARAAMDAGDIAAAKAALAPLSRSDDSVAWLWIWVAERELKADDPAAAEDALSGIALRLPGVPNDHATVAALAVIHGQDQLAACDGSGGDAARAKAGLAMMAPADTVLGLGMGFDQWPLPGRLDVSETEGELQVVAGQPAAAEKLLETVVAADPTRGLAWLYLGDAKWELKDKGGARDAYASAMAHLPVGSRPARMGERCPKCEKGAVTAGK